MNNYEWLDEYLLTKPGAVKDYKLEWGWWRYQVGGKLFAATCQPGPQYKGYDCRELLSLKCEPMLAELLRKEYPDIIPGFYMPMPVDIETIAQEQLDLTIKNRYFSQTGDILGMMVFDDFSAALYGEDKQWQKEVFESGTMHQTGVSREPETSATISMVC